DALRAATERIDTEEASPAGVPQPRPSGDAPGASLWAALSLPARQAAAATLEAAIEAGHNYLGGEHLLLGLLRTDDGGAARVLRSAGVDDSSVRRAVTTAGAGFAHARETEGHTAGELTSEILHRLEAVERRLGLSA
ncbi:MAG: hypothetical protein J2P59_13110, partial [Acidimicrobiales bacterium]|nr:hypothetical protein [Acidimicrobiales bacterium]